ncbi:MAG: hypothetical protein LQ345_002772 [Seirophora villosa]|nr:MAG: hypothetical protein LQ345_002772 [Seirophora villosa]
MSGPNDGQPASTSVTMKDNLSMGRSSASPIRQQPPGRASAFADMSSPLKRRRSSTFSDSIDDAKQSIRTSTDDLLLPRLRSEGLPSHLEPSHWHSTPLALALLPAIGGIFFQNGSAIVTDITLLGLAAIFLNWSVRLPWEWYHSAQSTRADGAQPTKRECSEDTIIEEEEEEAGDDITKAPDPATDEQQGQARSLPPDQRQSRATTELRRHELFALFACFLSPILGGWLLHAIRSQLSRPSEGLVSNYNITVFLLAAEVRPLSHLLKMVQARTLYLQRTLGGDVHEEAKLDGSIVKDMAKRLDDLEACVANIQVSGNVSSLTPEYTDQMKAEVRNSLQPDLDALNRAVRRYEKRMVALTIQTESRLQELESRMSDAITLAAAAERSSNMTSSRRGSSALIVFDWVSTAVFLPLQATWAIVSFPAKVAGTVMGMLEDYVGNKVRREMKTAGRTSSGHSRKSAPGPRGAKKAM